MKIIIGLGNPGKKYIKTRHNVGVQLLNSMDPKWEQNKGIFMTKMHDSLLVKSAKYFMNESGKIIDDVIYLKIGLKDLYVVHDDLDLKLGEYKIQKGVGPKVHGGITDIERLIGKDFWRIRIGIDNRGTPRVSGEEYVLQKFLPEELDKLQSVIDAIIKRFN